ncbi:hypothetical protein Tco_1135317 [Tanacetum coccineum]
MKKRGKGLPKFIKKQVLSNLKNGKIEADEELAHRLQAQEREGYSEANKAKLLIAIRETYKQVNSFVPMASDNKEKGSEKKDGGSRKKTLAKKRAGDDVAIFTEIDTFTDFVGWDVLDLYRLVKERFETASPEGYDRLLWGDLITVFKPSKDDKV